MAAEIIDLKDSNESRQRLELITFLSEIIERFVEGDLQDVEEIMVVWTNSDNLVDYAIPGALDESSVIRMTAPIFVEMSYNLSADRPDVEEES